MFKKNSTVGLSEVSKLIDSAISKRQGERRKPSLLKREKYCIKGKIDSLWTHRILSLDELCYEAIHSLISQIIFS